MAAHQQGNLAGGTGKRSAEALVPHDRYSDTVDNVPAACQATRARIAPPAVSLAQARRGRAQDPTSDPGRRRGTVPARRLHADDDEARSPSRPASRRRRCTSPTPPRRTCCARSSEVAVRGDEAPETLSERPEWRAVVSGPIDEVFARFAALNAALMARTAHDHRPRRVRRRRRPRTRRAPRPRPRHRPRRSPRPSRRTQATRRARPRRQRARRRRHHLRARQRGHRLPPPHHRMRLGRRALRRPHRTHPQSEPRRAIGGPLPTADRHRSSMHAAARARKQTRAETPCRLPPWTTIRSMSRDCRSLTKAAERHARRFARSGRSFDRASAVQRVSVTTAVRRHRVGTVRRGTIDSEAATERVGC